MENIQKIVWEWRFVLTAVAAVLVYGLFEWQRTKTVLYALMLQAKRLAKDAVLKSGQEQEDWVASKAMQFLPLAFRLALGEKTIRSIIRWLFDKAKDYLDNGKLDDSFKKIPG